MNDLQQVINSCLIESPCRGGLTLFVSSLFSKELMNQFVIWQIDFFYHQKKWAKRIREHHWDRIRCEQSKQTCLPAGRENSRASFTRDSLILIELVNLPTVGFCLENYATLTNSPQLVPIDCSIETQTGLRLNVHFSLFSSGEEAQARSFLCTSQSKVLFPRNMS